MNYSIKDTIQLAESEGVSFALQSPLGNLAVFGAPSVLLRTAIQQNRINPQTFCKVRDANLAAGAALGVSQMAGAGAVRNP